MNKKHVLVIEDEERIATVISKYLTLEGYECTCLYSGLDAISQIKSIEPDLCILDIMLPEMSGLEICQQVRDFSEVPIIMLTARVEEVDKLIGFNEGADDYVCKPFSPKELMARVAALLRRAESKLFPKNQLTYQSLTIDCDTYAVDVDQQSIKLTGNEFNILKTLMQYPEKVFSRKELLLAVKQHELEIYERTIDSHIKNLRKKLGQVSGGENFIASIYGIGYSLKAQ
ncbi:response regulator transcription factor [Paraglaciecola sp.]|uniref:response regulator transcription factor n=1 Tax=Paraglaciecola sp. TaxID=1920173 RepID=UPI003EF3CA09